MRCDKNGVGADFGHGHVYASDRWRCPLCGSQCLTTNPAAHYDPDYKCHDEYLKMEEQP
jgi:hypothetical protein